MLQKPGVYFLALLLLLAFFSVQLDSPPAVVDEGAPDSVFSATRAYKFLEEICKAPHPTGSEENNRVRDYIIKQCNQMGLQTTVQNTTSITQFEERIRSANVYNIIARLKGQNGQGKALMVMSHYDTQPNTPGAGDDGAAVAAMLETARILTSTRKPLQNDIIFLFTDSEEGGLSGAQGFSQDSVMMSKIGLVLNFEGRGNKGVSRLFEVNPQNGWVVSHYIKASPYPIGNSLGYEIYKTLPNDTDYTIFREAGIAGLNHAFADGFVNYHSPNDKPENLDMGSLQHHGDNMLSLTKYFGNISLDQTKADDITFFNIIGPWMVSYPASLNLVFTTLCLLLFFTFVVMGFKHKQITVGGFTAGFFGLLVFLLVMCIIAFGLIKGIEFIYPSYKQFYASNAYNAGGYFFSFTALTILGFALLYRWLLSKFSLGSLLAGVFLLESILLIVLFKAMPTAIFILLFPLLFAIGGSLVSAYLLKSESVLSKSLVQLLFLLPAIVWLSSAIQSMFVIFGLSIPVVGVIFVIGLLLGLLLPVLNQIFKETDRRLIPILALTGFAGGLLIAHIDSSYSVDRPLQSYVFYQLNANDNKAFWMSEMRTPDEWNSQFFKQSRIEMGLLVNDAQVLPLPPPQVALIKDTVENNVRKLFMHCKSGRNTVAARIEIEETNPALKATIQGPGGVINYSMSVGPILIISYNGLNSDGFDFVVESKVGVPFVFTLIDRSMGLPLDGFENYPPHVVPGTGWRANTTQVTKTFSF